MLARNLCVGKKNTHLIIDDAEDLPVTEGMNILTIVSHPHWFSSHPMQYMHGAKLSQLTALSQLAF